MEHRSRYEEEVVDEAKRLLIARCSISEPCAHRALQKTAMASQQTMLGVAESVIQAGVDCRKIVERALKARGRLVINPDSYWIMRDQGVLDEVGKLTDKGLKVMFAAGVPAELLATSFENGAGI